MKLLELTNVCKSFDETHAVREITVQLSQRKKIGILGQTGAGKTSLMKMIAGLEQPTDGQVLFKNNPVLGPQEKLIPGHEEISYSSQQFELPKFLTVEEALKRQESIREKDALRLYNACDITHLLEKDTHSLSGGEKQRVGLALSLIKYPTLLLLDEPFSNLDLNHKRIIQKVIENIYQDWVSSIILSSHDPSDLLPWADEIWVMQKGRIRQKGTPSEIYRTPRDKNVAGLTGPYSLINPENWQLPEDQGIPKSGKKHIIRPERISLKKKNGNGKTGEILAIHYQGFYDLVEVLIDEEKLYAAVPTGKFESGERVNVSISLH